MFGAVPGLEDEEEGDVPDHRVEDLGTVDRTMGGVDGHILLQVVAGGEDAASQPHVHELSECTC